MPFHGSFTPMGLDNSEILDASCFAFFPLCQCQYMIAKLTAGISEEFDQNIIANVLFCCLGP